MVINQMFPPEAYIYHTHPFLREHTQSSLFPSSCTLSIPVPNLCAHRDRESRPPEPDALHRDICSGVAGNQVFRGASSATAHRRDRLLPLRRVFFLVDVRADRDRLLRLLSGGRSRDCTANIFLHRLWSATSSNALCRLVRMEPPVPRHWSLLWVQSQTIVFHFQYVCCCCSSICNVYL